MSESNAPRPGALLPAAGGLAVLAAATGMTDMIQGAGWLASLAGAVAAVVLVGALLRTYVPAARGPYAPPVLLLVQLFVLLCCCAALFSPHAVLGVLPGPDAVSELGRLLSEATRTIQTGRAPVPDTAAMQCLITASVGFVTVVVDLLVVHVRMPAVAGLLLLGVYAVPASLAEKMLPWWSFALGAIAFALLLAVDRARRQQQWRGSLGLAAGPKLRMTVPMTGITALSLVCALLAGATFTAIGTTGNFPGEQEGKRSVNGSWGLHPMTKLQGELGDPDNKVELFRVRGHGVAGHYLRAVTLSQFDPKAGWRVGTVGHGQRIGGTMGMLKRPPGTPKSRSSFLRIKPVNWRDNWLPVFGVPRDITGVDQRKWRWDRNLSAAFARTAQQPGTYTEQAEFSAPSAAQLRSAPSGTAGLPHPRQYTDLPKISPSVRALAQRLTKHRHTTFDKAKAVWSHFTSGEFTYALKTRSQRGQRPLEDFLFHGKQGFCEQFASSMAVLLRSVGVPARVAVGFTPGTAQDGYRKITTQDAHAWVEVYFPRYGWMTFDPTPLTDGRGVTPRYLRHPHNTGWPGKTPAPNTTASPSYGGPKQPPEDVGGQQAATAPTRERRDDWWPPLAQVFTLSAPPGALWTLFGLVLAGAALTIAAPRAYRRYSSKRDRSGGGRHAR